MTIRKPAARPFLALGAAIAMAGTGAYWMTSPSPASAEASEPGIGQDFWVEVVAENLEFPWGIA